MNITFQELKEVCKRLPVGYYLGMKVPVIPEKSGGAYCDVVRREIHVGLDLIQQALHNVPDGDKVWDREKAIRCALYHEVGHILMTPEWATVHFISGATHNMINIIEDERLERGLRRTFIGVDFPAFIRLVSGETPAPKNTEEKLFAAVRLQKATPQVLKIIDKELKAIADIISVTPLCDGNRCRYEKSIQKIVAAVDEMPPQQEQPEQQPEQPQQPQEQEQQEQQEQEQGQEQPQEQEQEQEQEQAGGGEGDPGDDEEGEEKEGEENGKGESAEEGGGNPLAKMAAKIFLSPEKDVQRALERFSARLAKRKGAVAAGIWSALSGRISPKRDAMDKGRIFRRRSDAGERIMDKINLVLWVDESGSFEHHKDALNKILVAAATAMKMSNGKLNVKVVKMRRSAEVAKPHDMAVAPCGGNGINKSYVEAYKKTRDKSRRNIDIVVFDGSCCSTSWWSNDHIAAKERRYKRVRCNWDKEFYKRRLENAAEESQIVRTIWDSPDCWIVSDTANEGIFERSLKKAHRTYLRDDYAAEFEKTVINILDRVL